MLLKIATLQTAWERTGLAIRRPKEDCTGLQQIALQAAPVHLTSLPRRI